jgi:hypothetical protein
LAAPSWSGSEVMPRAYVDHDGGRPDVGGWE